MIARLSEELVEELERAGDQPLRVENPRNHKQYVIVAVGQMMTGGPPAETNGEWTEAKNTRRFSLIDKEIAGTLSPEEAEELSRLSFEIDNFLRHVAPLPIREARALHEQLRQAITASD